MSTVWHVADVVGAHFETPTARTLRLRIPGLHGHLAGQHVDVRLTAPDGYQAVRSYSIASALGGDELELTVEELADGEVSPYLVRGVAVGDQLEVRGPVGGWFVWRPGDETPVQLIAGGSGVVPLMSMARAHAAAASSADFRLLYSVRTPESVYYRDELGMLEHDESAPLRVSYVYTREAPSGWPVAAGRLTEQTLSDSILPASTMPTFFICGATVFVETVSDWLVAAGHDPARIKTERYGGIGGAP
ncbi:FAD-binding oxidoreductase [Leifsonia poae]|uniref:Oxidoreductase n=1 Tax=Leifsonia poae TaxID=110933 RepID=A0A9W6HBX1_9MICO|nr:FAD-binding oxidoreductase [Leifsonia poae]GLJ77482.1 oxidoreductase [Leifsonia poae]